jgi:Fe-Mn family superoxide dismutase
MIHKLPALPYAYDALEPFIDTKTMEVHHDKHHQTYLTKFVEAISASPEWAEKPVEEVLAHLDQIPEHIRIAVKNHGGGYYHHSLFWPMMKKIGGGAPVGKIADEIDKQLGGFPTMKENFNKACLGLFGSGWVWLTVNKEGKLAITATHNQDSPISNGLVPILGNDVWEHAYYLKYQNKRADYVGNWWNAVNWEQIEENYRKALGM